ncbi:hypothetical protein EYR36_011744 [Pleurotus pulmonarius]|nr:hypothetical protein EYR36_011744 [Pleurotus pulmonarius]
MLRFPSVKPVLAIVFGAITTSIHSLNAVAVALSSPSANFSVPTFASEVADVLNILIQSLYNSLLFVIASTMLWFFKGLKSHQSQSQSQSQSFDDLDAVANCSTTDVDSGNPAPAPPIPLKEPVFTTPALPQASVQGTVFSRPEAAVFRSQISSEASLLPTPPQDSVKGLVFSRPKEAAATASASLQVPSAFGQVVFTRPNETTKRIAVPSEAPAAPTCNTFGKEVVFTRPAPSISDSSSCPPTPTDNDIDTTVRVVESAEAPLLEDDTIKKEILPVTEKLLLVRPKERAWPMLMPVNGRTKTSDFPVKFLMIDAKLGQGTFGSVFRTVDLRTSTMYAVKAIEKDSEEREPGYQRRCVLREIYHQADMSMHDSYFAQVHGAMETATHYLIVQVHMIDLMQQNGILHRDIKPANILVDKDGYLHMTDFGLSHQYGFIDRRRGLYSYPQYKLWKPAGTPEYAPPEMSLGQTYNLWVDFYSLGIITYELLTGKLPKREVLSRRKDRVEAFEHPDFSEIPPNHKQYLSNDALDFIQSLVYDPRSPYRTMTISGIKAHPFLRNAPWFEIENNQIFKLKAKSV